WLRFWSFVICVSLWRWIFPTMIQPADAIIVPEIFRVMDFSATAFVRYRAFAGKLARRRACVAMRGSPRGSIFAAPFSCPSRPRRHRIRDGARAEAGHIE